MSDIIITKEYTIKQAIKQLDVTAKKTLFVADNNILLGSITDGDIRRWILKNGSLDEDVTNVMNINCKTLFEHKKSIAHKIMSMYNINAIPIVTKENEIVEIVFADKSDIFAMKKATLNNKVVVMAGGKGTRLYPYTQILPKPLIPIGEKSIIEHIFGRFSAFGCNDFILTLNYKKGMIKSYLDDLEQDYTFTYIEEQDFFGTAGSLSMLTGQIDDTFFVTNCDILVDADYAKIIDQHKRNKNKITMVTSITNYTIPYGVIESTSEGTISTIHEKPEYNFQINTGVYVLEPEVLEDIPKDTFFHITDLIDLYIKQNKKVGVFPIRSSQWLDMGEIDLMQKMKEKLENM
ncbi:MAG: nucleotidyltransferase [Epulopiscium sp. Nele67-Bin004]|nr:MAG: nucleotidyltransferase [Epulopiscium sp. Nele67-Bin004]